jgi:hypothetical protein
LFPSLFFLHFPPLSFCFIPFIIIYFTFVSSFLCFFHSHFIFLNSFCLFSLLNFVFLFLVSSFPSFFYRNKEPKNQSTDRGTILNQRVTVNKWPNFLTLR